MAGRPPAPRSISNVAMPRNLLQLFDSIPRELCIQMRHALSEVVDVGEKETRAVNTP